MYDLKTLRIVFQNFGYGRFYIVLLFLQFCDTSPIFFKSSNIDKMNEV